MLRRCTVCYVCGEWEAWSLSHRLSNRCLIPVRGLLRRYGGRRNVLEDAATGSQLAITPRSLLSTVEPSYACGTRYLCPFSQSYIVLDIPDHRRLKFVCNSKRNKKTKNRQLKLDHSSGSSS